MLPPSIANPLLPLKQLCTIQAPSLDAKGSTKADKGKGVQPSTKTTHSKDAFTIRDMVTKAKDGEPKSKVRDTPLNMTDPKEDPSEAKA